MPLVDNEIHLSGFVRNSFYLSEFMFKLRKACVSFISFFDFRQIDVIGDWEKLTIDARSSNNEYLIHLFRYKLFHHIFNTRIRLQSFDRFFGKNNVSPVGKGFADRQKRIVPHNDDMI